MWSNGEPDVLGSMVTASTTTGGGKKKQYKPGDVEYALLGLILHFFLGESTVTQGPLLCE